MNQATQRQVQKAANREFERCGFQARIIGAADDCQLWINGALYGAGIKTLREARRQFNSFVARRCSEVSV